MEWIDSTSLIDPAERKALMFEQRDGMLRNILTRAVPALAADYAHRVLKTVLGARAWARRTCVCGPCTPVAAMCCTPLSANWVWARGFALQRGHAA